MISSLRDQERAVLPLSRNAQNWLTRYRQRRLHTLKTANDNLLEYAPRDPWNLTSISAAHKQACAVRGESKVFRGEGIELCDDISQLKVHSADAIICDHVLEYLLNPAEVLFSLKRAAKPGGFIIVFALYDPGFNRPRFDASAEHYFSWNVQTLGNLLIDCGYEFVSGVVRRAPREPTVLQLGCRFGFATAAIFCKFLAPVHEVQIVARRPGVPGPKE